MQAWHGRRPDAGLWEQLERSQLFSQLLESARHNPGLASAVTTLGSSSTIHEMDQAARTVFRRHAAAVADWHPRGWRPALRWVDTLPDLPLLRHLLAGGPPPHWLHRDRRYASLAEPRDAGAALAGTALAPLAGDAAGLPERWRRHWQRLQPRGEGGPPLNRLEQLLWRCRQGLAGLEAASEPDSHLRRDSLDVALTRIFRRHAQSPAASFAHLGLVWLDLQRLRGALVRRAALG